MESALDLLLFLYEAPISNVQCNEFHHIDSRHKSVMIKKNNFETSRKDLNEESSEVQITSK